ncbi:MAG: bacteriophage holin [Planctomycetota bacterium]|nr:bacteriophage holin [Planctomycetota bacterium]
MKLNTLALGITLGLLWGLGLFIMTWWVILLDGSSSDPTILSPFYRGYTFSPMGSLIGLFWAIPDGFLGGVLIGWTYNQVAKRLPKPNSSEPSGSSASS